MTPRYRQIASSCSFAALLSCGVASAQSTVRLEAETMQLDSFRVEAFEFASNGGLINLKGPANKGAASAAFPGESAEYDVFIVYHDENDGVAQIDVLSIHEEVFI